jgi:hypothetical protein
MEGKKGGREGKHITVSCLLLLLLLRRSILFYLGRRKD